MGIQRPIWGDAAESDLDSNGTPDLICHPTRTNQSPCCRITRNHPELALGAPRGAGKALFGNPFKGRDSGRSARADWSRQRGRQLPLHE